MARVKFNGAAQKTATKFGAAVRVPRVRGNGFRHSSCVKKVSFERKGNSFLFHNGAHPLCATRHARVSDYSEDRAYPGGSGSHNPPTSVSLSLSYVCAMYTRSRDEGVSMYYARTRAGDRVSLAPFGQSASRALCSQQCARRGTSVRTRKASRASVELASFLRGSV